MLAVGLLIFGLAIQSRFGIVNTKQEPQEKNYRAPQPSGFAELAASMRSDRKAEPTLAVPEEKTPELGTRRIVIERKPPSLPPLPRYYSHKDDAQAANTLRTLKLQALTAKPVVEGFENYRLEETGGARAMDNSVANMPQNLDSAAIAALLQGNPNPAPAPNGQLQKENFLRASSGGSSLTPQGYSNNLPVPQQFPYELKAGTIIPALLVTGINSDLPGNVIGQVSENVWDTATGRYVLIPKGTRILGVYDSQVTFGQRRVLLVWNRLIFPNGMTLDIAGSPGVDQAGYSGLSGRVNEHWGRMLRTALLASLFVAGAEIVYGDDSQGMGEQRRSPRDVAAESVAGSILEMGSRMMNRASDIQPTITIRPGKRMGIFVQRDVVFPHPYF